MNKAIFCRFPRPEAAIRLFCFPWAGGGTPFYAALGKDFPDNIEVCAVRPPGREIRLPEPMPSDMDSLIQDFAESLIIILKEKPFIFFGHSFGGLCAYELAVFIKREYGLEPLHLFLSGCSPPHTFRNIYPASQMTDENFIDILKEMQGTPEIVLKTPDLLKMVIKIFKGDLLVLETYKLLTLENIPFLLCPFTYLDGENDLRQNHDRWAELTSSSFDKVIFPGGHFYLIDPSNKDVFIKTIFQKIIK